LEKEFQKKLKKELEEQYPGIIVQKMESYTQGFPDLLLLYNDKWAMLECKKDKDAEHQPNQDTWVDILNDMSFSAFIYPENKEEVLGDLQRAFRSDG
ncbi:MAG: VRR-NUC domain-containing protein, partial [Lachnospiraceae bacterium]|nr:VRR-NUC domain-containing protein [Candidatus Minthocola equi]